MVEKEEQSVCPETVPFSPAWLDSNVVMQKCHHKNRQERTGTEGLVGTVRLSEQARKVKSTLHGACRWVGDSLDASSRLGGTQDKGHLPTPSCPWLPRTAGGMAVPRA